MEFKPTKLGRYLLLERLATGGMAEVYRAKASGAGGFEKQLAIKLILPNYSTNEEFRQMFEYEARLSSMLTQANIVQIYDFVKSGDTYLLAMEYVDGKNLRQLINKAKKVGLQLPMEFSLFVINEVCKGLEYAHAKRDVVNGKPLNIVHRDMSPQNIMVSYDGAVKIVDFGIAKAKDKVDETRSGVIKGKFGYMSPEQANGEVVDHRTDIFSTGIILWELLTGKRLFVADNDMATLRMIQECVIPPPSRLSPKVPGDMERIVLKALTKDLSLRYQNAGNFHKNLQEFMSRNFPSYTQREVGDLLQKAFKEEIIAEKKRLEEALRQSIPYSQGGSETVSDDSGINDKGEMSIEPGEGLTRSEVVSKSDVTVVEDLEPMDSLSPDLSGLSFPSEPDAKPPQKDITAGSKIEPRVKGGQETVIEELPPSVESAPPSASTRGGAKSTLTASSETEAKTEQKTQQKAKKDTASKGSASRGKERSLVSAGGERISGSKGAGSRSKGPETHSSWKEMELDRPDEADDGRRRRERSISASKNVSDAAPAFELESAAESAAPKAPRARQEAYIPDRGRERDGEEFLPRPNRLRPLMNASFFIMALGGVGYLYQLYFSGGIRTVIDQVSPRTPATPKPIVPAPASPPVTGEETSPGQPALGDCVLEVTTDPAAAKVILDGVVRGTSTISIAGICNKASDLTIVLDGYETVNQEISLRDRQTKFYKTLKKIPSGTLELRVNQNAKVFIDGEFVGEVKANESFERNLRAGKTYKLRFVNEIFGVDVTREYVVEENILTREVVRVEEGTKTLRR